MNRRDFLPLLAAPLAAAPKARLRTAICAYSLRQELGSKAMTYEDLVAKAVEWNVDGLDLTVYWLPNTDPAWLRSLRRLAYRNGVEIYSISVRSELTKASPHERGAQVESLAKWVDVADSLGASHIRVFGGNVPKGFTEEQAVPWVVECLSRASEYAGRRGVILGLENHGGITTRADRILEIVEKVNSPWVGINLDTGNFESDTFRQIEKCLPKAVNTQVKVEMRDDAGKKVPQDWDRVVRMIAASGYRGYLALEYEAAQPALSAMPPLLNKLRALAAKYSG